MERGNPKLKGNPGPCANRNRGWRGALQRPARLPNEDLLFDPSLPPVSWGQPLHGVRRQQQHNSQSDKQSENEPLHGLPSFLVLRRAERRLRTKKRQPCKLQILYVSFPGNLNCRRTFRKK